MNQNGAGNQGAGGQQPQQPVGVAGLQDQIAQLQAQIDAVNLVADAQREINLDRQRETARRAVAKIPKYDGERKLFRQWYGEFCIFCKMHQIPNIEDEEFKKMILFSAFEGKALDMIRALGPEGVIFPTLDANEMTQRIKEVFQPEAESAMARQEFVQRKQSASENISIYAETKIALYLLAYPAADANFPTLLTEFIRGIYNITIKKRVRQQNPRTLQELRNVAIQTVAIEREAFLMGMGNPRLLMV